MSILFYASIIALPLSFLVGTIFGFDLIHFAVVSLILEVMVTHFLLYKMLNRIEELAQKIVKRHKKKFNQNETRILLGAPAFILLRYQNNTGEKVGLMNNPIEYSSASGLSQLLAFITLILSCFDLNLFLVVISICVLGYTIYGKLALSFPTFNDGAKDIQRILTLCFTAEDLTRLKQKEVEMDELILTSMNLPKKIQLITYEK